MNKLHKRFITIILAISTIASFAKPLNVLDVRDSIDRAVIIYPESFETDVHKMQENWYLRNYADIDRDADNKASINPSDEEIIERLKSMPTEIEMPFNSLVKAHIVAYTDRRKQLVENMLGMSLYYMPIFEQALDKLGLPLELKYLPIIESALNPDAVSRVGATGLWQFMLPTATGEGLEVNTLVDQRRDPYASSAAAAGYLKKLYEMFGDWSLAIASYNCGPGNVSKALRRAGDGKKDFWQIYSFLPAETRGYVPAFIAANYVMNFYNKHNISPALARKPIVTDTVMVSRRIHFEQIQDVLGIPVAELRALNPQYRKDVIPGDIHPYSLVLPTLQIFAYVANEDSIANHNSALYSHRDIVEPTIPGTGSNGSGEFIEESVVKYHTVKRGETLTSIAKKYGVTAESIRKTNKIGKHVNRGQKLKINTVERRFVENKIVSDTITTQVDSVTVKVDSVGITPIVPVDSIKPTEPAVPEVTNNNDTKDTVNTVVKSNNTNIKNVKRTTPDVSTLTKPITHKVAKGESLYRIATKYGITVNELKTANNLKNDNIQAGQVLKIPQKK